LAALQQTQGGRNVSRQRKHLFHFGVDQAEWRKITAVAARENVSFAEATRILIRSCNVDDHLIVTPPPKKRRRPKAQSAAVETSAS
jgi:hypothetical protein